MSNSTEDKNNIIEGLVDSGGPAPKPENPEEKMKARASSEADSAAGADAGGGAGAGSPQDDGSKEHGLPAVEGEKKLADSQTAPKRGTDKGAKRKEAEKPMSLMEHLGELRSRLVRSLIAVGIAFMACYSVSEEIFGALMKPLVSALPKDSKLIFTALPEAFFVYMQVALVAAIFLASPFIFYQIWAFIAPGLYEEEKRHMAPVAAFSAAFFILGASFCYFMVFPFAFSFFMGFATDIIVPMPSLSEYLSFALKLLIAFGLIFEMPLFSFFLSRLGIVKADDMRKARRYAILVIFIVAAILTPPDVLSQLLMAGPMLILYELSIFIAAMAGRKKAKKNGEPA